MAIQNIKTVAAKHFHTYRGIGYTEGACLFIDQRLLAPVWRWLQTSLWVTMTLIKYNMPLHPSLLITKVLNHKPLPYTITGN